MASSPKPPAPKLTAPTITSVNLPQAVVTALDDAAWQQRITRSALIRRICCAYLARLVDTDNDAPVSS